MLTKCTFINNSGGAVVNQKGQPNFINCRFVSNSEGGVRNYGSSPKLINCIFVDNKDVRGGGMFNRVYHPNDRIPSKPELVNCTFINNRSSEKINGAGIFNVSECSSTLTNCILWDNTSSLKEDIESVQIYGGTIVINDSCLQGWSGKLGGSGNFGNNPLFVDPNGPDNIAGTEDDNLRLSPNSYCINRGDNTALPPDKYDLDRNDDPNEPIPFDFEGKPRILNGRVDVGAYESG